MKAFLASTALLLACATIWGGPADDLVKNGDEFDLKLQASQALDFYLAAEKLFLSQVQKKRMLILYLQPIIQSPAHSSLLLQLM